MSTAAPAGSPPHPRRLVFRNTLYVVGAQVLVTPLTILVNAIVARRLGAAQFGQLYLATTFASLAGLFVEWGQGGALTGGVARERGRAGLLLGSSLAWRSMAAVLLLIPLLGGAALLGYDRTFLSVLALAMLVALLGTYSLACHDVFRGLERTDIGALTYVGWQALIAATVIPVMLLGGHLHALLATQACCAGAGAVFMWFILRPMGVPSLHVSRTAIRELLRAGTPFLIIALVIAFQTNVDALLLSKLGSAESVGWHAAARKLVGLLIFPATALINALYPTLCRLHLHEPAAYRATAAGALHLTALAVMPVALGCALFPDVGVRIFSEQAYGPAADNLRILAAYILLVYFSMPLGCALTAAGRQHAWAVAQLACLAVGTVLDALLIPWFQAHYGNGGLGVCVATLTSEVVMVTVGTRLLPAGVLDRALARKLLAALFGGACMAGVACLMRGFNSFIAAPPALLAYALGVWAAGGIDLAMVNEARAVLRGRAVT